MTDARRQLKNAKKLVRLRLVEQSRAAMAVAEAREHVRKSTEALAAAEAAVETGDAAFKRDSPEWGSISNFVAALEQRMAQTTNVQAHANDLAESRDAQGRAIEDLQAHDARRSAAEELVLVHRQRLRQALERLEQSITDDLSVLKKGRDA